MAKSEKVILVTGGAGYIGSQTCVLIKKAGYLPVAVDNLSRGNRDLVKCGPLEEGNLEDEGFLDDVLLRWQPSAVVHLAAYAYVRESIKDPAKYYQNNLITGLKLLEALRRHNIDKLIFSSTCSVYGEVSNGCIAEDTPTMPTNSYGASKLAIEHAISSYTRAYGLKSVILRYFNVAGADPDGRCGERHDPEPHIIPRLIFTAFGRQKTFKILGDDFPTDDGTCIRDYIHVHDVARAHLLSLDRLLSGGEGLTINLANGVGYSVKELIAVVKLVTKRSVPWEVASRNLGDPASLVANADLADLELNWRPRYTDIKEIIHHAVNWYQKDGQI